MADDRVLGLIGVSRRVLVVEDDQAVAAAVQRGLKLEGFDVGLAAEAESVPGLIETDPPSAIVLDVGLPGDDGIALTRRLRATGLDVPICMLSARADIGDRVAGLEAGADDYLVKPFAMSELVARLHALLRRAPNVSVPTTVGDLQIDPQRHLVRRGPREIDLTRREFELLTVLAEHAGIVLSRTQLLELVWGYDFEVDTNVVDVFVGYLRRKLELDGEPRMVHTVRGIGFVLRP